MSAHPKFSSRGGFSLVEVCLALLVVAIGLLAVFGLFPSSLRSGQEAQRDTRTALFAEHLFNGIRARSDTISVYTPNWSDGNTYKSYVLSEFPYLVKADTATNNFYPYPLPPTQNPDTDWVRYRLYFTNQGDRVWTARLVVFEGKYGGTTSSNLFVSDFFYWGL